MSPQEQDDAIVAAILEFAARGTHQVAPGAYTSPRKLTGDYDARDHGYISISHTGHAACCAVGAGILAGELSAREIAELGFVASFARQYDVSYRYVLGVSDGFEFGTPASKRDDSYDRGFVVGERVWQALYGEKGGAK